MYLAQPRERDQRCLVGSDVHVPLNELITQDKQSKLDILELESLCFAKVSLAKQGMSSTRMCLVKSWP